MSYLIFTDASADVDPSVLPDVQILPMGYSLGSDMLRSYGNETAQQIKDFYNSQRNGDLTKTTQISPFDYAEYFTPYLQQGIDCLYISLSSGLSSTYQSACVAQKKFAQTHKQAKLIPIDSTSATGGMGILVERAVRNKQKGMSIEDNGKDLEQLAKRIHVILYVNDLDYLKRGGRISALVSVVGTILGVKPILRLIGDGTLKQFAKQRGPVKAANMLASLYKDNCITSKDPVYITDADTYDEANRMEALIQETTPSVTIRRHSLSPIIGAHTGPSTIIVCYSGKPRQ